MIQISPSDVQHLAQLSSLELKEDEIPALQQDLERIINYIEQLAEVDTQGVEPTYEVTGLSNVWREDEMIDYGVSREQLIALAPDSTDDSVKVPKVL